MLIRPSWRALPALCERPSFFVAVALAILVFSAWSLLRWPVVAPDTDLWFHLDYGRFIVTHRAIPQSSYFSFLSPAIPLVDSSWLFQVGVYLLHSVWGYAGLIVLRSGLYLVTTWLMWRLLSHKIESWTGKIASAIAVVSVSLFLYGRYSLIRPYLMDHLFIAACLWVLERHPRRAVGLVLLGLLWVNMHGTVFPILVLILLAYGVEYLVLRATGRLPNEWKDASFFLPLAVSMLTVVLTPHGFRLLDGFPSLGYASRFIAELQPVTWEMLTSFQMERFTISQWSLLNIWWPATAVCAAWLIRNRCLRISHLVLWLGALALLLRGVRFSHEYLLLTLPLVNAALQRGSPRWRGNWSRPAMVVSWIVLVVMAWTLWSWVARPRPAYPMSRRDLPVGVARFLDHVNVSGEILSHPNAGGYLRWALFPRYRIFVDQESPGIPDEIFHLALFQFDRPELLKKAIARYHPSFISVPFIPGFPDRIREFPDYVLVFFDDVEVLYVNRSRHPQLAERYELVNVDPFQLAQKEIRVSDKALREEEVVRYLPRMLAIDPDAKMTNHLAAAVSLQDGRFDQVLEFAEAIIRSYPELPIGYALKAEALRGLGAFDNAVRCYRLAITRADGRDRYAMWKAIGEVQLAQGDSRSAYRAFTKGVRVFDVATTAEELRDFATAARLSGHAQEADALLKFLSDHAMDAKDHNEP